MAWEKTEIGYRDGEWIVGPAPNEETLAIAYLQMKQNGHLDLVFPTGAGTLREFLDWMLRPGTVLVGAWRVGESGKAEFVGCGFVNEFLTDKLGDGNMHSKCEVAYGFIDNEINIFRKSSIIKAMMAYVFERIGVNTLIGTTPEPHQGAISILKRSGMRQIGVIPNFSVWNGTLCGVVLSQCDRWYFYGEVWRTSDKSSG